MEQERPGFAAEKRADNDNRKPSTSVPAARVEQKQPKKESLGERWSKVQPTKMTVFWLCLAAILLTMLVGFNWGGWVRGSTAQKMATVTAQAAVVQRLTTICVAQFNLDAGKDQKLTELQATSSYERAKYVTTQGWATAPGEEKPASRVADACAKQLMLINP
jgi:hypothetical protein